MGRQLQARRSSVIGLYAEIVFRRSGRNTISTYIFAYAGSFWTDGGECRWYSLDADKTLQRVEIFTKQITLIASKLFLFSEDSPLFYF